MLLKVFEIIVFECGLAPWVFIESYRYNTSNVDIFTLHLFGRELVARNTFRTTLKSIVSLKEVAA